MIYDTIQDDYFGIKIVFDHTPITGYPFTEFMFSGHELLVMLLQSWPIGYELIQPRLHFSNPAPYPVKATTPAEWLDFAQLPRQEKKYNAATTPKLVLDIGGRKIIILVPSDKYTYDKGELPLYTVRTNIPSPDKVDEKTYILLAEPETAHSIVSNPNSIGQDPIVNEQGKERLSYLDFYAALKKHYGDDLNSSTVVAECRRILSGDRLHPKHAKILPVMMATMFGSEVSRNRACLVTGIMLLDLIESKIIAPSLPSEQKNVYCFENCLWHPQLHSISARERHSEPNKILGKIGGFHPMAHQGSWDEEFKNDGPYQQQPQLTFSHVKSVVILIDWLCNLKHPLLKGIRIVKLNKNEYTQSISIRERELYNIQTSLRNGTQLHQPNNLVIINLIYLLVRKRFRSFDHLLEMSPNAQLTDVQIKNLLNGTPNNNNNVPLTSKVLDSTNDDDNYAKKTAEQEKILSQLNAKADIKVREMTDKHQQLRKKYLEGTHYSPRLENIIDKEIKENTQDELSSVKYIIEHFDPAFTIENFRYCKKDSNISNKELVILFFKLFQLNPPLSISLKNMLLNINNVERLTSYKLIFTSPALFKKISNNYASFDGFIIGLSHQFPLPRQLVDIAFEKTLSITVMNCMEGKNLFDLCDYSDYFFKRIIIDNPFLFKKILSVAYPYQISEKLYKIKSDRQLCPTPAEWRLIYEHHYSENIDSLIATLTKDVDIILSEKNKNMQKEIEKFIEDLSNRINTLEKTFSISIDSAFFSSQNSISNKQTISLQKTEDNQQRINELTNRVAFLENTLSKKR